MRRRLPVLALLCTAQFVNVLDVNAVIVALPAVGADLGLRGGALQWVVTAYVLVFAGCLLAAGRLADALGRRRVFVAGLALFTAASLACGLAPTGWALVAARALQGLGAALTAPAALALLVDAFPAGALRERAVAVWTAVAAVGGAAGLVLGGLLAGGPGWRWVFLVNVPVGLVALALAPRLLAERRGDGAPGGLDLPGAALATAGLALLVLALAEAEASGLGALPAASAAAALACLAGLVVRERSTAAPLVPPALLGTGAVAGVAAAAAVLTAATSGGGVLATLHLQDVAGLGPRDAGLVLLPLSLAVVAGSAAAARLDARAPAVIAAGLGLVAAGSLVAVAGLGSGGGEAALVAWGVLAGFGLGAASVAATALGTTAAAEDERGTVSGLLTTAAQVGTALGVAGLVLVAGDGAHGAGFAVAAGLAAGAALLALTRVRPRAPSG